ncbi:hypothetical protein PR048_022878 [Dryococelus australis]|uniref:Uncharacterized protein n=1 Tax=Dryococelus australis TaxID=614101 RepID=A0ABQ9GSI5_9NEOP|nr:hypothetical protein PR048_022878 [Dryococelus australis]
MRCTAILDCGKINFYSWRGPSWIFSRGNHTGLVSGFSRGYPISPALAFRRCSTLTSLHLRRIFKTSMFRAAQISPIHSASLSYTKVITNGPFLPLTRAIKEFHSSADHWLVCLGNLVQQKAVHWGRLLLSSGQRTKKTWRWVCPAVVNRLLESASGNMDKLYWQKSSPMLGYGVTMRNSGAHSTSSSTLWLEPSLPVKADSQYLRNVRAHLPRKLTHAENLAHIVDADAGGGGHVTVTLPCMSSDLLTLGKHEWQVRRSVDGLRTLARRTGNLYLTTDDPRPRLILLRLVTRQVFSRRSLELGNFPPLGAQCSKERFGRLLPLGSREPTRVIEVGMEHRRKIKDGGNGRSPRKLTDQRHRLARFPHAKIRERPRRGLNPEAGDLVHLSSTNVIEQLKMAKRGIAKDTSLQNCLHPLSMGP